MIRSEREYKRAVRRFDKEKALLSEYRSQLKTEGLSPDKVKRLMGPLQSFTQELENQLAEYERIKRGDIGECNNLHGIGRMLIAIRIALGLSQREFAKRIGVHPTQVCRDERNEYHGITIERAASIFDTFEVELSSSFRKPPFLKPNRQKAKAA